MGTMKFDSFKPGDKPVGSNLEILHVIFAHSTMSATIYRAKMICCGTEKDISHVDVRYRMRAARERQKEMLCLRCQQKANSKKGGRKMKERAELGTRRDRNHSKLPTLGWVALDWPVPPMALEIHKMGEWEGR